MESTPLTTKSARPDDSDYPLLVDFEFPPFASVEPRHVRPGIRSLLHKLESDLEELEQSVEPTWEKLMEPLEKIVERLAVVCGMVNHLKGVKDSEELRSAIDDVQEEKVKFQVKLGQSKPVYGAFKASKLSRNLQIGKH